MVSSIGSEFCTALDGARGSQINGKGPVFIGIVAGVGEATLVRKRRDSFGRSGGGLSRVEWGRCWE